MHFVYNENMKFTCKLNIQTISSSKLFIPISRDIQNFNVKINKKTFKEFKTFEYGIYKNKGIAIDAKENWEIELRYHVSDTPKRPQLDPSLCLSNNERYTKWKTKGVIQSHANEYSSISISEYISITGKLIKNNVKYKGYTKNEMPDKFEYTDEILEKELSVDCIGFHSLLVSFLRAREIPAVLDIGFRLGKGDNPHVWAWFWDKEWKRIDLLDGIDIQIGDNSLFPRVSLCLGTTHLLETPPVQGKTISYLQYVLSDSLVLNGKRSAVGTFDSFIYKNVNFRLILKVIHGLFSYDDFLYLLQLEDYLNNRYLKTIKRFLFRRELQQRDFFKKTTRIEFIKLVTILLQIFSVFLVYLMFFATSGNSILGFVWSIYLAPVILFLIPYFVFLANTISSPLYNFFRKQAIKKATKKIFKHKNLKIIMISGSFGKTSIKNFIFQLISHSFRTQMTAGNINTHTGIANWINNYLQDNTEVLITEVDGFHEGEIRDISKMIPADIVVITYLGDQHLERLGSRHVLAKTLNETIEYSKENSQVFISEQTLKDIEGQNVKLSKRNTTIVDNFSEVQKVNQNLSDTNTKNLTYALHVAQLLKVPEDILADSIEKIELPDRRQKLTILNGFTVLDDSYNISLTTAKESLKRALELSNLQNKKLIVIFAGIPELGVENKDAIKEYTELLVKSADYVIVLNSIYRKDIEQTFVDNNFTNYKVVFRMSDATSFYQRLYNPSEWLILLHPELTDLSY